MRVIDGRPFKLNHIAIVALLSGMKKCSVNDNLISLLFIFILLSFLFIFYFCRMVYLKRTSIATGGPSKAILSSSSSTSSSLSASSGARVTVPTKVSHAASSHSSSSVSGSVTSTAAPHSMPISKTASVPPSNAVRFSPTATAPLPHTAASGVAEDEEDFTLLMGMEGDDSSGDEEVLEEG